MYLNIFTMLSIYLMLPDHVTKGQVLSGVVLLSQITIDKIDKILLLIKSLIGSIYIYLQIKVNFLVIVIYCLSFCHIIELLG